MSPSIEEKRAGLPEDFRPRASVIVCAYSNERLPQLKETIASLQKQTYPPSEIVLIIDHNPELQGRLERLTGATLRIAPNRGERGLANARNTGIALAEGEVLAFIDDDAAAESRWLEELVACYQDPDVIGAGGRIEPVWEGGRKPTWLPEEFLWTIGCSYRGMAEGSIRNMIGCNMSFRSSVFEEVGPFNPDIGRLGSQPLGCEETEICIRALERWPGKKILYAPEACGHERGGWLPISNAAKRHSSRGSQCRSAEGCGRLGVANRYDRAGRWRCGGWVRIRVPPGKNPAAIGHRPPPASPRALSRT